MSPASRYSTSDPATATATFRLAPEPTIGDLHGHVEQIHRLGRDARPLVPEHRHGPLPGGGQVTEPDRLVGELDADDPRSGGPLVSQPLAGVPAGPVHAGRPQRGGDQVVPARMAAGSSLPADVVAGLDPDLRAAHRLAGISLSMDAVLSGARGPSPVTANLISV
jgi:hypothetical protein